MSGPVTVSSRIPVEAMRRESLESEEVPQKLNAGLADTPNTISSAATDKPNENKGSSEGNFCTRIFTWISSTFSSIVDTIRNICSKIPVIGKWVNVEKTDDTGKINPNDGKETPKIYTGKLCELTEADLVVITNGHFGRQVQPLRSTVNELLKEQERVSSIVQVKMLEAAIKGTNGTDEYARDFLTGSVDEKGNRLGGLSKDYQRFFDMLIVMASNGDTEGLEDRDYVNRVIAHEIRGPIASRAVSALIVALSQNETQAAARDNSNGKAEQVFAMEAPSSNSSMEGVS